MGKVKLKVLTSRTVSLPPNTVVELSEEAAERLTDAHPGSYEIMKSLAEARPGAKASAKPAKDKQVKKPKKAK